MSAYLEIRSVTKRFGDFSALRDVSLDIAEGEFVCFLGPSGCGKTTLLRAIAGLDIQSEGVIRQAGRDVSALPPEERDFGIVFQSYALFPNLTVRKNIGFGLRTRGAPRGEIDRRVDELLEMIGLPDKGDSYPAQISGGQQQRVALARALAPRPGLILLDEPLSALDAKVRLHLREELKTLQRQLGVTMVMVTHDQDEALSLADRIVVMNVGVVEQVGTPFEIYDHPASRFVADFIGAMNFFPGAMTAPDAIAVRDLRLHCTPNGHAGGQPVTVAIRPEDVALAEDHESDPRNLIEVGVGGIEFLGAHARAQLVHDAFVGAPLVAQLPQAVMRRRAIARGQQIRVRLPEDRLRIFDGDARHG
ncbi:MAG: putative 2-aminoethylphosphonate ABC transporter ATP-binding protein [Rhodobacterales bacterium CG18_big_fil_WC_8_21_14_2_50_71_9]|nr:MAG: putative 2-aminoethylphosphonate ABC transporter ATP-binding protein [Rhodobacterales bacterium CG18_big_fil_WC_8_21_14_2_50_71_9]PJA59135.1 MAG: putative 2-aminoethylphosphonate ABC transporter ATP-binding protein [Rhodobacterales bacterium CG_4_9_14_3_um_filter_71_31]